jgi:hypothetical protein
LAEVERLDSKLPTLVELAECTEQLGRLVEAQALWTSARERAKHDEKPQSRARAETQLAAVQKRLAHLTLQLAAGAPADVQVLRDEVPLDAASLGSAMPSDPGEHVIVVRAAGHDDAKYAVKLADADNQSLSINVGPASTSQVASAPPPGSALPATAVPISTHMVAPTTELAAPRSMSWWSGPRKVGAILGGVGIAGIAGGSVLALSADRDAADPRLALGGVSIATGGVLLITGLVLLASSPGDDTAPHARLRVVPSVVVARSGALLGATADFW